ncbi:TetR/AcrR family transcriptional regulator [Pleomorphomonas sp. PLEO]|uniref:TetR/AcrR family transcriptional regulator n=1 Tax=Pleomorphomonas sp. PLEO TaxID=3239306 RepID=UPI00351DCF66
MVDSNQAPTRGPGRPPVRSDEETRAVIIAAAARAFLETGYIRTGIDTIARDAGVSTRTLYRLFSAKEDLLKEAMEARIDVAFGSLDAARVAGADPHESLAALLFGYAGLALSDEAVRLTRLIAAERHEVPALANSYRQATARITGVFEAWIGEHQQSGFLRPGNAETTAHLLRGTINEAQRQILLGLREPFTVAEQRDWVKASVAMFLDGLAAS